MKNYWIRSYKGIIINLSLCETIEIQSGAAHNIMVTTSTGKKVIVDTFPSLKGAEAAMNKIQAVLFNVEAHES